MVGPKTKDQKASGGEGTRCWRNHQATHLTMLGLCKYTIHNLFWVAKAEEGAKPTITTPAMSRAWIQTLLFYR